MSDFTPIEDGGKEFHQDFVAIDRFTGGGAESLKFDAKSFHRPVLRGSLTLDLEAVQRARPGEWCLGLMALVLRDLCEGDIPLGFGAAKGYGACTASLEWNFRHGTIFRGLPPNGRFTYWVAELERALKEQVHEQSVSQSVSLRPRQ